MSTRHSFLLGPGRWTATGRFSGADGSHPACGETAVLRDGALWPIECVMEMLEIRMGPARDRLD
jgi:hypothetical protein